MKVDVFRGGYGEGKKQSYMHFFIGHLYGDCECNADRYLWGNALAGWILHMSILVYGREHVSLGRHVGGNTKCW